MIAPLVRFTITVHFCSFHQNDRRAIVNGFKRKITLQEAMTGREFCNLINIDYDDVLSFRQENQSVNFRDFIGFLLLSGLRARKLRGNSGIRGQI